MADTLTKYDKNQDEELNPADIAAREKTGNETAPGQEKTDEESKRLGVKEPGGADEPSLYTGKHRNDEGRGSRGGLKKVLTPGKHSKSFLGRHKTGLIIGGAAGGTLMFMFGIILILILLLAPYKNVHFATILRSVGLARFTYVMNKQMSRTLFDAAVLTKNSTGRFNLPKTSLFYKLVGINPTRQLAQLGSRSVLQFDFKGTPVWGGALGNKSTFQGVTIKGEPIYLDDVAQKQFGKDYDQLNRREARRARNLFADTVRTQLSDAMKWPSRRFRWGVYKGFYQATGIKLFKWFNKADAYKGVSDQKARSLNLDETLDKISRNEGDIKRTGVDAIDEDAKALREAEKQAYLSNSQPGEVRSKLATKVRGVRAASTIVMIATFACVAHSLANAFNDPNAAADREGRVARTANDSQSGGDQTKFGDTQNPAVGADAGSWNGAEQSAIYHQITGQALGQGDAAELAGVPSVLPPTSTFKDVITTTNSIAFAGPIWNALGIGGFVGSVQDGFCNVLLNDITQYGLAGAEGIFTIASAGTSKGIIAGIRAALETALEFGASIGLGDLLGHFIDDAIHSVADTDYSGLARGKDKFDQNYVATDYTQQVGNRQITFGAPMDATQTQAAQLQAMADLHDQYNNSSFTERYFAMDNPFSLAGAVVASIPTSLSDIAQSIQRGFASLVSIIGSPQRLIGSLANIIGSKDRAWAASAPTRPDTFGVDEWGWTPDELAKIDSDPSFDVVSPDGNDLVHIVEPHLDSLNAKYGPCYAGGYVLQAQKPAQCTRAFLTTSEALHWRVYMAETYDVARTTGNV